MISKNKFDVICSTIDNGIIVLNKSLDIIFWNKWLEIRTNKEASLVTGKKLTFIYPNIDEKRLQRKIITALKLNSPTFYTPQTSDYLIDIELGKVADKVFNHMQQSITVTPLDLEEGLVIIYIYDITLLSEINYKLKETKAKLTEKNEELQLLLDTTMEAIILFKDDRVIDCNKVAVDLFLKSSKYDLINKDYVDILKNKEILESISERPIETSIKRDDKSEFKAIINIKDTQINSQIFKILTIVDIEDIKRKEIIMAEQSKLAAMGEMIGNIAHQWRQPLNIISITASNISLKHDLGILEESALKESFGLILNTTEHLSNTIDTFNDFLKHNKEKSLFNLSENIHKNISIIDKYFQEQNIELILELDDNIYIYNLANEFNQAFLNILNNAKDAINLKLDLEEKRFIKVSTIQLEDKIEISILDNAGGINLNVIDKIFEPYFTTKHKYQGTGLGLYIAHKIIKSSMGGEITARNLGFSENHISYSGALFKITIPNSKG